MAEVVAGSSLNMNPVSDLRNCDIWGLQTKGIKSPAALRADRQWATDNGQWTIRRCGDRRGRTRSELTCRRDSVSGLEVAIFEGWFRVAFRGVSLVDFAALESLNSIV